MFFWFLMGMKWTMESVAVKRIMFIAVCLISISGSASAYQVYLRCPESVQAGLLLNCSVDSNLPAGTTFDVVFYQSVYLEAPFSHRSFVIREDHATMYQSFDTKGLPGGSYKVEVRFSGPEEGKLSSDSVTLRVFGLIDRSGEITITSPLSQTLNEALRIEGSITRLGNKGVDIEVRGRDGFVFGPQYTGTKVDFRSGSGVFTQRAAVTQAGTYDVYFRDSDGYIGMKTFSVIPSATPSPTTVPKTTGVTSRPTTSTPASLPTTTASPLSLVTVVAALAGVGLLATSMARKH
jgi:hypothetical protein